VAFYDTSVTILNQFWKIKNENKTKSKKTSKENKNRKTAKDGY